MQEETVAGCVRCRKLVLRHETEKNNRVSHLVPIADLVC